jgi:predicted dehydrogenase
VGCVGLGFIAGRHLAALASFPDVDLVAVADTDPQRARQAASGAGTRCYDDGPAMLAAEDLDAVWLCVPPAAHGPLEDAAVRCGVPLFVEKPLAVDLATALRTGTRLADSGLVTAVGYHWRALSVVRRAQQLMAGASARLLTGAWLDRTPAAPWWARRDLSGGQLIEQTTHLFDLARLLGGEITTVQALEVPPTRDGDVPVASAVLLGLASGAIGTLSSSRLLPGRTRVGLQLVADGSWLDVSERSLSHHELRIGTGEGEEVVVTDEDPIAAEDRAFLDAVRGERASALVPYEEALRTHAVVCAADRSARDGGTPVVVADHLAACAAVR